MAALPEPFELFPGAGTCSIRPGPPFWAFFGADCWPLPEAAAALLPAGAGAAEVADGAEEALLEPAERALSALLDAAGSADSAEDCSGAGAGLGSWGRAATWSLKVGAWGSAPPRTPRISVR